VSDDFLKMKVCRYDVVFEFFYFFQILIISLGYLAGFKFCMDYNDEALIS